jgi:hypothetical protein
LDPFTLAAIAGAGLVALGLKRSARPRHRPPGPPILGRVEHGIFGPSLRPAVTERPEADEDTGEGGAGGDDDVLSRNAYRALASGQRADVSGASQAAGPMTSGTSSTAPSKTSAATGTRLAQSSLGLRG